MENPFKEYIKSFTELGMWNKISQYASKAGQQTVYTVLLLFYAFKRKDTPLWARNIIIGTIGYFISPIDALPDLTPIIGYTDDIGVLSFGLVTIACYVNIEVKTKARTQLKKWFKNYNEADLKVVDEKL
ncbi:MAG: uncharacterized membrane protein YkvA (DUF1232 family) [Saprospiraceae bacterium]|jgi:uncharacterized membrane protein YkvA (DUF1232 family)